MLLSVNSVFGQTYVYSYQGNLSIESQQKLIEECSQLPHVSTCKIRQKDEKGGGEIIVEVEKTEVADKDNPFSVAYLKNLIISNGLSPIACTELKSKR